MTDELSPGVSAPRFDHVAIATWSIADALVLFQDVLGGEFLRGGDDERLLIRTLQLKLPPGVKIELMEPTSEESYLSAFLEKHGPGFHHVTLIFDDVEKVIPILDEKGFDTVDTDLHDPQWRETFIRPSKGFGTLLQLVDTDFDWLSKQDDITADDVVAGRLIWQGGCAVTRDEETGGCT
jgi:methylmalonyl-CoA/ethylmalonyl-CoA epimerase